MSNVAQTLDVLMSNLFDNEILLVLIKSNPKKFTVILAESLLSMF